MLRGNRSDYAALVLIGLIFALLSVAQFSAAASNQLNTEITNAAQREDANRGAAQLFALMDKKGQDASTDERERAREDREKSDLDAQWATARWTQAQFIVAVFGLLFTGGALIFAYLAWQASKAGVQVARDIGQKQVRAYLSIRDVLVRLWPDGTSTLRFEVSIHNSGASVARRVRARIAAQWSGPAYDRNRAIGKSLPSDFVVDDISATTTIAFEADILNLLSADGKQRVNLPFDIASLSVDVSIEAVDVFDQTMIISGDFECSWEEGDDRKAVRPLKRKRAVQLIAVGGWRNRNDREAQRETDKSSGPISTPPETRKPTYRPAKRVLPPKDDE